MELDLEAMHETNKYETIIAVLLVCDWNVRALSTSGIDAWEETYPCLV